MNLAQAEREKYEEIWTFDEYNTHSPGEDNVERFLSVIEPSSGQTIIDIGCGAGKAGLAFKKWGLRPTWLDITGSALKPEIDRRNFIEIPIWGEWRRPMGWDYGFCCDVMEHIPTEFVMLCAERIIKNCRTTWFQIANLDDNFSGVYGKQLHLTVRGFLWWKERLGMIGNVTDARDLCGTSMYVVKR